MNFKYVRIQGREMAANTNYAEGVFSITIIRETHIKNMYWKPHSLTD